jgi:hypothetical protein
MISTSGDGHGNSYANFKTRRQSNGLLPTVRLTMASGEALPFAGSQLTYVPLAEPPSCFP